MNAQEVMNALSEIEQFFFYKKKNPQELEYFQTELTQMHEEAKTLLCQWHNLTGCKVE